MSAEQSAGERPPRILAEDEVSRRMLWLAALHDALDDKGIHCVLARNHRLVLQYTKTPCPPSGLTNPTLHVFLQDGIATVTTDGSVYDLPRGSWPVTDPAAAAAAILRDQP